MSDCEASANPLIESMSSAAEVARIITKLANSKYSKETCAVHSMKKTFMGSKFLFCRQFQRVFCQRKRLLSLTCSLLRYTACLLLMRPGLFHYKRLLCLVLRTVRQVCFGLSLIVLDRL